MIHSKWCSSKMLFAALITAACLLSNSANAQLTFTAEAINGKVVDEETGAPLTGVIIVAEWYVQERLVGRGNGLLNVLETVSDKDGNYGFPSWGPKLLPISPFPIFGSGNDPLVMYFKNGYWPTIESNDASDPESIAQRKPPLGGFQANGKVIKLRKWDGKDEAKYYSQISGMIINLKGVWKNYPRMTLAIDQIFQKLLERKKRKEIPWNFPIPHVNGFFMEDLSAEDKAYLKDLAK